MPARLLAGREVEVLDHVFEQFFREAEGRRVVGPDPAITGVPDVNRRVDFPLAGEVDVVLADLPPDALRALRVRVASREGAIVPVIAPDASGRYPLLRLLAERSVSINTAAAGGNAALLALGYAAASA